VQELQGRAVNLADSQDAGSDAVEGETMNYTCKKCGGELPEDMTKECPTCYPASHQATDAAVLEADGEARGFPVVKMVKRHSPFQNGDTFTFDKQRKPLDGFADGDSLSVRVDGTPVVLYRDLTFYEQPEVAGHETTIEELAKRWLSDFASSAWAMPLHREPKEKPQ
jgi:hypothetical protein